MRKISYKGKLMVTMNWSLNGKVQDIIEDIVGDIPIMVKVGSLIKFVSKTTKGFVFIFPDKSL